jgi:hypothetical protein
MLYDSLTEDLGRRIAGAETLISDFAKLLEKDENPDELRGKSAQIVEEWQHYRDRARRGQPKLQATLPINLAALAKLRAVMERHPVESCPDLMSTQDWNPIATVLDQITTARSRWVTTRWPAMRYDGEVYRDQRFELVRPDTVGELRNSLTKIILSVGAIEKRLQGKVRVREGLLQRHAALSPEQQATVSDRRRFELDHSARTLDTAKSHVDATRKEKKKLLDLRARLFASQDGEPVSDHVWGTALQVVSGIAVTDFDLVELLPEVTAREEIEVDTGTGLQPDSTLEAYRHIVASNLYADDLDRLPHEVLVQFEPIWASAALDINDGMGGTPRWDNVDPRYFQPELFMAHDVLKAFLDNDRYSSVAPAPFNRDNAMLLQLFSDPLMGWMWGDVSRLVLLVPRDDLAKAKFDNVIAIIGG